MLANLTGWHLLTILAVLVLLFGAAKLPSLAKAFGQSARILKTEMKRDAPSNTVTDTTTANGAAPTGPAGEKPNERPPHASTE